MRAVLVVDHGSRSEGANAQLAEVARLVQRELGEGVLVAHAHLTLGRPTVPEAIAALAARGARELVVHPYFLAPGRHATEDLPRLVREAEPRHPGLSIRVSAPLGVHELLAKLVALRCRE